MTWQAIATLLTLAGLVGAIIAWAIWGDHSGQGPPYPHD